MPLNGAEWKDTAHQVRAFGRDWDVVVHLDTGTERFRCIIPALPGCTNEGVTPADALAGMKEAIDEYLKAGKGGFGPNPGTSIQRS